MNRLMCTLMSAALLTIAGCKNESDPGGPGVTARSESGAPARTETRENTFTLKVPSGTTDVERGKREEVTISIERREGFNQDVRLKFKTPAGVKITPADPVIKAGQNDTKVFIEAENEAVPGEKTIEVTATPQTGAATSMTMRVKVETN